MKKDKVELSDKFDHEAGKALGTLVQKVIDDPSAWERFHADPVGTAEAAGVKITDKMQRVILRLGEMSDAELELLSGLNKDLMTEGLYAETGNPPLMVF